MQKLTNYYQDHSDQFGWGMNYKIPEYQIKKLLPLINGKKILDIGCGPGHLVDILYKSGFTAFGVDFVSKFIQYAQKHKRGQFFKANAEKLPFKNKEFDTVILKSVLEHLKDDQMALKEALRVGKRIIIIVPQTTPSNLLAKGLIFSHYQDKSHLRTYTPQKLRKLIKDSNAKLIKMENIEKLPNKSVIFELLKAPVILKRILIKLLFLFTKEEQYYLELLAIIKPC